MITRDDAWATSILGAGFKIKGLDLIPEGEEISFYYHGTARIAGAICARAHVDSLRSTSSTSSSSTWRAPTGAGTKNPMLQRIYSTAFWTRMPRSLEWLEEVKKRDHRKLGTDLDLFSVHATLARARVLAPEPRRRAPRTRALWWDLHTAAATSRCTRRTCPAKLVRGLGAPQNYGEMMYAPMELDELPYRVKPMNCPGHALIFKDRGRSYRELPLRWAELGTVYRYERSGVVHGMLRVRGFTQDDAHIFCTPDQLADEIAGVCKLVDTVLTTFGFEYKAYLATKPAEKTIGDDDIWGGPPLERPPRSRPDPGARRGQRRRHGPDRLQDQGRPRAEWQGSTIQCDFSLPERFDLTYTDSDGGLKQPIMVHRAILGSLERFVGGLIEHFGGKFPFWIAPTQVAVIPIRGALALRAAARGSPRVGALPGRRHAGRRPHEQEDQAGPEGPGPLHADRGRA